MTLATLDSQAESDYLLPLYAQKAALFDVWTHIGGVASTGKSLTDWYWVGTGEKVNFPLKFGANLPDNIGGNEVCLVLAVTSGSAYLNDAKCYETIPYKFICQSKIYDTQTTVAVSTTTPATTIQPVTTTVTPDVVLEHPGFTELGYYSKSKEKLSSEFIVNHSNRGTDG
jgi:hypothetical protein